MAVSAIFVSVNYVISVAMAYSLFMSKTVKRQFYCIIVCRYFSSMYKEKGSETSLGLDPFFRGSFCILLILIRE